MKNKCLMLLFVFLSACSSYITPGREADLSSISQPSIKEAFNAKPALELPAHLTIARIQGPNYKNNSIRAYGHSQGNYSFVGTREIETEEDIQKIKSLTGINEVGFISRLMLPQKIETEIDFRNAAARLRSDLLLLYTFSTNFRDKDVFPPLSLVSLGFSPTQKFKVTSTASAIILDVKTGFVYGVLEDSGTQTGYASAWDDESKMEEARLEAERVAFEGIMKSFEPMWLRIYERNRKL